MKKVYKKSLKTMPLNAEIYSLWKYLPCRICNEVVKIQNICKQIKSMGE